MLRGPSSERVLLQSFASSYICRGPSTICPLAHHAHILFTHIRSYRLPAPPMLAAVASLSVLTVLVRASAAAPSSSSSYPCTTGRLMCCASTEPAWFATKEFMHVGAAVFTIGAGLLYTLGVSSNIGRWLGYQIVAGVGAGASVQIPFIAVQVVTSGKDMPTANALVMFFNSLGGAVSVSIAQNIFINSLVKYVPRYAPGVDPQVVLGAGARTRCHRGTRAGANPGGGRPGDCGGGGARLRFVRQSRN